MHSRPTKGGSPGSSTGCTSSGASTATAAALNSSNASISDAVMLMPSRSCMQCLCSKVKAGCVRSAC